MAQDGAAVRLARTSPMVEFAARCPDGLRLDQKNGPKTGDWRKQNSGREQDTLALGGRAALGKRQVWRVVSQFEISAPRFL